MTHEHPQAVAIIPARGGSKGVPGKNVAPVGGVPLVGRAILAALAAPSIGAAYVSTDDADIAAVARQYGAEVIDRPASLATDTATSEDALLHALDAITSTTGRAPRVLAFLQATSPFIDSEALERATRRVLDGADDVVFSAFETYAFLWRRGHDGAEGVNHDHSFRPRRQDREPHFQETGAFYVMRVDGFQDARFRFFGRVGLEQVPEATAVEIDTPDELEVARRLAAGTAGAPARTLEVDALVMDFDGVHTDDLVSVDQNGVESVRVSRSDGMGIGMLREAGLPMLILSKERNPVVAARGAKLGVEVLQGIDRKATALRDWCAQRGIALDRVAYVGNDVNDIECLEIVGWPVVVPEAGAAVAAHARLVLTKPGGAGAVRELAEMILKAR
ncbi:acylneuraminate cytidylyltransferase [Demequina muriae]|uniref:N-acylneuraminate cytidylyltransferase n=1 Tax=Demequina muriae TaxID=3051664 RepID=A0ABT8GG81_9MICO|nr:acylneuraminate cytidylyltransferase [Demequina sp. EGI L300058]MDN4480443.1 acylneuraminate cytidylyltransferase [Demequina sp. EGI L300058]